MTCSLVGGWLVCMFVGVSEQSPGPRLRGLCGRSRTCPPLHKHAEEHRANTDIEPSRLIELLRDQEGAIQLVTAVAVALKEFGDRL